MSTTTGGLPQSPTLRMHTCCHQHADSIDAGFEAHSYLVPDSDPSKGRLMRASGPIQAGTVVLVDTPYAIVPNVEPTRHGDLICSNLVCSRRLKRGIKDTSCPKKCSADVVWCDEACRAADHLRHEFECSWLKQHGEAIRDAEGEYNFVTLWHVVRILAGRNLEEQEPRSKNWREYPWQRRFSRGWKSVDSCCAYVESWPDAQIKHWRRLAESYLNNAPLCVLDMEEMLSLICKEETNTFGLYSGITGPLYMIDRPMPRGEAYGLGIFPRAAMFNHSCTPNLFHVPCAHGHMVFTTARDIAQDEECTISYFDLTLRKSLRARKDWTIEQFRFFCTCERCIEEEAEENLQDSNWLPF